MSVQVDVNGTSINYPQTGDTGWGDEATQFAIQTSGAFSKLGLDTGTTVDIPGTLDVTQATTLDSTLDVDGATQLNSTLDVTGNTNLSGTLDVLGNTDLNGSLDVALSAFFASTVTIVDDLVVDTDTLFVDVSADRVGINIASPSEALDVVGNIKSSGSITGSSATLTDLTVDTNVIKTDSANNRVGINTTSPTVALDVTGDIKQSGVSYNSDGSVSSPSITFTNDTNTGIYRIGSDSVGISSNGTKIAQFDSNGITANIPYWNIVDQKTSGTAAGTFTSGAWRTRDLNTTIGSNSISGSSLSTNQFTLPSGTYRILASAPTYAVNSHKAKLRNITDSSDTIIGTSERSDQTYNGATRSFISGVFTIAAQKTFEIQHYCSTSQNFGQATSFGVVEIYTVVELWKLA